MQPDSFPKFLNVSTVASSDQSRPSRPQLTPPTHLDLLKNGNTNLLKKYYEWTDARMDNCTAPLLQLIGVIQDPE